MIPTRIFFQIHYSRILLITYWLNDFLSGNLVSFRIVSSAFKLLIHPDSVSSFVWSRYGVFFPRHWTLSTRLLEKQADYQPRLHELYRGVRGHAPWEKFWKIGLSETPSCIPWIKRDKFIRVFCWAFLRVLLFMIPEPKCKDSWFPSF